MAGGVTHLWKEWEIQILVLLSFSLQLILLVFAWIRRHKGSTLLRILLWLAYLMADSTAIYTLGHLSLRSRSHEHQLVVFWAQFLLLHLGGPDTITAYAFEDNQLWLRHLLTLAVQVLGAAYVLYQSIASHGTLFFASILMFVTGFLKYGERTWALKCANLESIRSSQLDLSDDRRQPYDGRVRTGELDDEEVLLGAHYTFNVCKSVFADNMTTSPREREAIGILFDKYLYELIEMQLSLMYDILYTKAAVIHTWYGSCIRAISPLATLTAFLLFELNSRDAYSVVDVAVTYVLLVGAFVLEITSLFRAMGSSWTCAFLHAQRWDRLHGAVLCLRRRFPAACSRRWLHSIGQYNLLDFCTRDKTELRSRITKKVGLEDWWNKFHYSSITKISENIRDLVLEEIPRRRLGDIRNARGRWALGQRGLYDEPSCSPDVDFAQSILIWHVATDVYLCCRQQAGLQDEDQVQNAERLVKAIKQLSDYMMFLFVVYPYMLHDPVRNSRYQNNCNGLVTDWQKCSSEADSSPELTHSPELTPREKLARWLHRTYGHKPSRNTSDNPSSARGTGGDSPSPATDTGGVSPSPARGTGGDNPLPSTDTGGDSHSPARGTDGDNASSARGTSGDNPSLAMDTGGDNHSSARGTGGDNPSPATDTGGDSHSPARDTGGDNASSARGTSGDNPSLATDTSGDSPSSARGTGGDNPSSARGTGGDNPSSARGTGGDSPSPATDTGGVSPSPARGTGGDNPSSARGTGGDSPSPATDTGGDSHSPARDTGGDNPSPATDTGGDSPSPATDTGGDSHSPARDTGGDNASSARGTSGDNPSLATDTGGDNHSSARGTGGDNPSPATDTGGDSHSRARDTGGDNPPPVSSSSHISDNNPLDLAYIDGAGLVGQLLEIPDALEMIVGVWIEMLCYAAHRCSEVSHAKQLSSGGELVTAMGFLVEYIGRYGAPAVTSEEQGETNRGAADSNPSTNGAPANTSEEQGETNRGAADSNPSTNGAPANTSEEQGETSRGAADSNPSTNGAPANTSEEQGETSRGAAEKSEEHGENSRGAPEIFVDIDKISGVAGEMRGA